MATTIMQAAPLSVEQHQLQPGPQPSPTAAAQSQLIPPDHHRSVVKNLIVIDMIHNSFLFMMLLLYSLALIVEIDKSKPVRFFPVLLLLFCIVLLGLHGYALFASYQVWNTTHPSPSLRSGVQNGCCGWCCITIVLIILDIIALLTYFILEAVHQPEFLLLTIGYASPLVFSMILHIVPLCFVAFGYNKEIKGVSHPQMVGGQGAVFNTLSQQGTLSFQQRNTNPFANNVNPQQNPSTLQVQPPQQATTV